MPFIKLLGEWIPTKPMLRALVQDNLLKELARESYRLVFNLVGHENDVKKWIKNVVKNGDSAYDEVYAIQQVRHSDSRAAAAQLSKPHSF